jgi:hypothetical protein
MTDNEMLDKLNDYLSQINKIAEKANKLAEEYQKSVEQASEDMTNMVLSEYLKDTEDGEVYYMNSNSKIDTACGGRNSNDFNPYINYPSHEFAERAQKLKVFNDMLLAFKWCYDRDYEPIWDTHHINFFIQYDVSSNRYEVNGSDLVIHESTVYFSNRVAASKCAAWLNKIDSKGELIS